MATIEKRVQKDGTVRWRLRVHVGRDENGRQRFVRKTFRLKKDAEAEVRRLEAERDHGGIVAVSKDPLKNYLKAWLDLRAPHLEAKTLHEYRGIVRRYIQEPPKDAPPIGLAPIGRLTASSFEQLYGWMHSRGLAPKTIRHVHAMLRQALKAAVRKRMLTRNPTDDVDVPKRHAEDDDEVEEKKVMRAISEEEAGRFLEAARSDRYFALWATLLTGGLRPGEALGLRWSDVNLDAGRLHVDRALIRVGRGWKLKRPKTAKARRVVALPPVAAEALREWRRKQAEERMLLGAEYQDNDFVFANPFGKPLHRDNLGRQNFRRICERAGLGEYGPVPAKPKGQPGPRKKRRFRPRHRPYDLRHTCATLLLKKGVNVKIVSELLGHASVTLTLDIYSHVIPGMQEMAATEMEAMFGPVTTMSAAPGVTQGSQPDQTRAISVNFPKALRADKAIHGNT